MIKKRYAVFYNPSKSKPWAVVAQMRSFGFWLHLCTSNYETEEQALRLWREDIERELNQRLPDGTQKTEWKPDEDSP